jgi:trimeric autotransporter adhesin
LSFNTTGDDNTALGHQALDSNKGGDRSVAIGSGAGGELTRGDDNVAIANPGVAGESGAIRVGTTGTQTAAFIAGVSGKSIPGPAQPVLVNDQGQLGTASAVSAAKSETSTDRKLSQLQAAVKRLQRENRR